MIHQINEHNTTENEILEITQKQERLYKEAIEAILDKKNLFLRQPKPYQKELLLLNNSIKLNKAKNNKYAVLRDEVLKKSYHILQEHDRMLKHILRSLNLYSFHDFNKDMNDRFIKNQLELEKIDSIDYRPFLALKDKDIGLKEAQKNIKDYYALIALNSDIIKYYSIFEPRLYRLNKYKNYHILSLAIYLDHTVIGQKMNPLLYPYNLSIVKLFLILIISLFIYMLRKKLNKIIEKLLSKVQYLKKYSHSILGNIYAPFNVLFLIINLHIIIHIYHDFNSHEIFTKFFNITYSLLFCFILYRIINAVAAIVIHDINASNIKIKSEMVNVGLKIINFFIMVIGLLLVMYFSGANLTAVLSGLGIGGLAVAFAAKETLSNFLGTISILMSDIFSQGDWIVVNGKEGTVIEIGLRVTTLRTFENGLISIPNGIISNQDVINWSRRKLGRKIKMSIGLKYDSTVENIHNAIEEIRDMLKNHPNIASNDKNYEISSYHKTKLVSEEDSLGIKKTMRVYLDELADSSINILMTCFSEKTDIESWLETKEDIIYKTMDIIKANDLEFAYPSLSLYHENKN